MVMIESMESRVLFAATLMEDLAAAQMKVEAISAAYAEMRAEAKTAKVELIADVNGMISGMKDARKELKADLKDAKAADNATDGAMPRSAAPAGGAVPLGTNAGVVAAIVAAIAASQQSILAAAAMKQNVKAMTNPFLQQGAMTSAVANMSQPSTVAAMAARAATLADAIAQITAAQIGVLAAQQAAMASWQSGVSQMQAAANQRAYQEAVERANQAQDIINNLINRIQDTNQAILANIGRTTVA